MTLIDTIRPETVDKNVAAIMHYMKDMRMCTQTTMGERLGMSSSAAGAYLNECVERNLLTVSKKRPLTYSLPSSDNEKPQAKLASVFEHQAQTEHMSIYVDASICAKIKALSVLNRKPVYGGQGQLIADLVDQEFSKVPETYYDTLAKLIEAIEDAERLKSQIPNPVEWENADAQSDQD